MPLQGYDFLFMSVDSTDMNSFCGSIDPSMGTARFIDQVVVKSAYATVGDWPSYRHQARFISVLLLACIATSRRGAVLMSTWRSSGSGYNLYGRLLVPGGVTTAEWL